MIHWFDKIFNLVSECEDFLDEGVRRKVIRKGKLTKKLFSGEKIFFLFSKKTCF